MSRNGHRNAKEMTACKPLVMLFRKLLTNIEGCKRAMCKEYFLRDLRNTREKLSGKELKKVIEFFYLWQNLQDIFHLNVFEAFDPNFFVN